MTSETRTATMYDANVEAVVEATEETFGEHLVRTFPRARTGDIDPMTAIRLTEAIRDATYAWVRANLPPMLRFNNDTDDDVTCSCGNDVMSDGFHPVTMRAGIAVEVQPVADEWPLSLFQCGRCEAIYHEVGNHKAGETIVGEYVR